MIRSASALLAGTVFGLGLAVSQMINPAKVLAFLDLLGRWDPSLALVMAGAVGVAFAGFRLASRRSKPVLGEKFDLPRAMAIDGRLGLGAALFGIGWGLVGFCPGPALASLAYGRKESVVFVVAMFAGMWLHRVIDSARRSSKSASTR